MSTITKRVALACAAGTLFALSIGFVFAFGFIVLLTVAVYMSNQIAGPLYRTKKGLDRVGRGEWGFHLQFRQGENPFAPKKRGRKR